MQIPHVNRQEYTLLDVSEDGYVSIAFAPSCLHRQLLKSLAPCFVSHLLTPLSS